MQTDLGSPTGGGLPKFAQKTLLEHIENSGGLDRYRNQDGKKDQLIRPLLEKFPNLFGGVGDQRRKQARDVIKYWYNHFYEKGKYPDAIAGLISPSPFCLFAVDITRETERRK